MTNDCFSLVEKLFDEKLVKKVLRLLPKHFDIKVTTIEEVNNISTMKLDELFESLHILELMFNEIGLVRREYG